MQNEHELVNHEIGYFSEAPRQRKGRAIAEAILGFSLIILFSLAFLLLASHGIL